MSETTFQSEIFENGTIEPDPTNVGIPAASGKYFIRNRDGRFLTMGRNGSIAHFKIDEFDKRDRWVMLFSLREIPENADHFYKSAMVAINDYGLDGDDILIV